MYKRQIAAYASLVEQGEITLGEAVNVVVPTGNFGNILAAYYAKAIDVYKRQVCLLRREAGLSH